MILAIVPENVGFRKVEKGFSPPCFPQNFQLSRVRFYFFLKLSLRETLRLNTKCVGEAS